MLFIFLTETLTETALISARIHCCQRYDGTTLSCPTQTVLDNTPTR